MVLCINSKQRDAFFPSPSLLVDIYLLLVQVRLLCSWECNAATNPQKAIVCQPHLPPSMTSPSSPALTPSGIRECKSAPQMKTQTSSLTCNSPSAHKSLQVVCSGKVSNHRVNGPPKKRLLLSRSYVYLQTAFTTLYLAFTNLQSNLLFLPFSPLCA